METKLTVIQLAEPCTACHMLNTLTDEVVAKLEKKFGESVATEKVVLAHPKDARTVEGLEVEKFPALLVDGIQFTAGSIPNRKQIEQYIIEAHEGMPLGLDQ